MQIPVAVSIGVLVLANNFLNRMMQSFVNLKVYILGLLGLVILTEGYMHILYYSNIIDIKAKNI